MVGRTDTVSGFEPNQTADQVVIALRRIIRAVDLHSRVLVTRYGLTGPQLTVLKALRGNEGVSVTRLGEAVHLSQATVTGILDRLTRAGLVTRQRSTEDRRRMEVWLTDAGRETLGQAPPALQEHFGGKFRRLPEWEQTMILAAMQRLVAILEARDLDAAGILTTGPMDASPENTQAFLGQARAGDDPQTHPSPEAPETPAPDVPGASGPAASEDSRNSITHGVN